LFTRLQHYYLFSFHRNYLKQLTSCYRQHCHTEKLALLLGWIGLSCKS